MDELTPGIQTSEFWGKVGVQVLVALAGMFHKDVSPEKALIIVGSLEAIYAAGRSLIKAVRSISLINPVPTAAIPPAPRPSLQDLLSLQAALKPRPAAPPPPPPPPADSQAPATPPAA